MRPIRYVCLTDLHPGGARSLLADVVPGESPDMSDVLRSLVTEKGP